jgi:hypothetical protein
MLARSCPPLFWMMGHYLDVFKTNTPLKEEPMPHQMDPGIYLFQIHIKLQEIPRHMHFRRSRTSAHFRDGFLVGLNCAGY